MAKDHGAQVKKDKLYEDLRDEGMSKEKAARISNAKAAGEHPSHQGGKSPPYEEWSVDDLHDRARDIGIEGQSDLDKDELIRAIRQH